MATRKTQAHIYLQPDVFELLREKAHIHRTTMSRIIETSVDEILGLYPGESFDEWCSRVEKKGQVSK